jgi:isopentenyldiphosphate isomerase
MIFSPCSREGPTEIFDVLDCTGNKTGKVIARDDAHEIGEWHGAFHCLLLNGANGSGFVLFQKRSATKQIAPGKFDVSVGGHYASGEDAKTAGPREIREELGLDARYSELIPVGRRVFVYCFTHGVTELEFQDVFLLDRDIRPGELELQQEELDGVIMMDVASGIELFSGRMPFIQSELYKSDGSRETVTVHVDDFVPCVDNYYLKLLLLARRYFNGERELLVI